MILYTSFPDRDGKREKKVDAKKVKKTLKKVLTRKRVCGILFELSSREGRDWTLKIKQRDKKRNPRFDSLRTIKKSFKKYFSNSNTEAKIAKY